MKGGELLGLAADWSRWAAAELERFEKMTASLRGVDDFLLECGDA